MKPILEAKKIQKSYKSPKGKLTILKGVDLSLRRGEISFILGRSGSGKSTLLHILGTLDKFEKGELLYEGEDIQKLSESDKCRLRNKKIGFVFQFYHLLPELTLLENILLPGIIGRVKNAKSEAKELLAQVELTEREQHFPHQLSGGEQQRAAIVRALLNKPEIVLCDEPTGNLDEESSEIVMELIEKLNRERKQTFCIVTHDEALAKRGHALHRLNGGVLK